MTEAKRLEHLVEFGFQTLRFRNLLVLPEFVLPVEAISGGTRRRCQNGGNGSRTDSIGLLRWLKTPALTGRLSPITSRRQIPWSPVRLRDDLGMVVWRAPDAVTPMELAQLVTDTTRLLGWAGDHGTIVTEADDWPDAGTDDTVVLPPFEIVTEHVDTAIRHGMMAPQVESYLNKFELESKAYRPYSVRIGGR